MAERPRFREVAAGFVLLGAASASASPSALTAQERVYDLGAYEVRLDLREDGAYDVVEWITFDFWIGTFTFATRDIPLARVDSVSAVRVVGEGVEILETTHRDRRRRREVRWMFPERTGAATFRLEYTVYGALREAGDRNEVFWAAVGEDWPVTVRNVTVQVAVPAAFAAGFEDLGFEPAPARLERDGAAWLATFTHAYLPPRTAYRVRVEFPRALAGRAPWPPRPSGRQIRAAVLALLVGLVPGLRAAVRGRAPRPDVAAARREATAPPDIDFARAAVLLYGERTEAERAFPATLIRLAMRGRVRLHRIAKRYGPFRVRRVKVELRNVGNRGLTGFESEFLRELRRHETLDQFGDMAKHFRSTALRAVCDDMERSGLVRIDMRRNVWMAVGIIGGLALGIAGIVGAFRVAPLLLGPGGLFTGIGIGSIVAAAATSILTEDGAAAKARVLAYQEQVRETLGDLVERDPLEAARFYIRELSWLLLDPKFTRRRSRRLIRALKKSGGSLEAPDWALEATGERHRGSDAYVAFMPYFSVVTAATTACAPAAADSGAGAGGGGAAGGGGGGAG